MMRFEQSPNDPDKVILKRPQFAEGVKYDAGKLRWSLIPNDVMTDYIKVLEFGAAKYSENNWKYVDNGNTRYYDATMRHMEAWLQGENVDQESGISHLAHAMCCITFLMWLEKNT